MRFKLITVFVMLLSYIGMAQETKTISGTVSDSTDVPLPGAQLKVQGKEIFTVSDFDGNFTLEDVEEGDVFRITFLGFQPKEVTVGTENEYNVVLQEEAASLNEVVVIGYGEAESRDHHHRRNRRCYVFARCPLPSNRSQDQGEELGDDANDYYPRR